MALKLRMDSVYSFENKDAFKCEKCNFIGQVRQWHTDDNEHIINWGHNWLDYAPRFCPQCGGSIFFR